MMTGAPYFDTQHADVSVDELWDYMDSKLNMNYMITACSHMGNGSDQE